MTKQYIVPLTSKVLLLLLSLISLGFFKNDNLFLFDFLYLVFWGFSLVFFSFLLSPALLHTLSVVF